MAGQRLHLDTRQPRLGAAVRGGDDRVVKGDFSGLLIPLLERRKALPLRAHAEEGPERLRPGDGAHAGADRSIALRERLEFRAWAAAR